MTGAKISACKGCHERAKKYEDNKKQVISNYGAETSKKKQATKCVQND